eukprot:CCRYP_017920-RA/>CCRYP_017920-RA protein AED:0.00 eAED:0.00 QI:56/1/0.5/1/0/0/2/0/83
MLRNLRRSLTLLGGDIASIDCTFLGCGLIPSRERMHPRYSVSMAQKFDLQAFSSKFMSCSLERTNSNLARWSSKVPLVIHSRS